MNRVVVAGVCAAALAGGVLLSAQDLQLPSEPKREFGGSVTGAFEGWFDNADGTHSFLVGYFSRNTRQVLDIPIGPNNRIEPGGPDLGQPTHFLPGRNVGIFTVTVPREFAPTEKLVWTLVVNGRTTSIPLRLNESYNISPFGEEAVVGNRPPVVRFEKKGPTIVGPIAATAKAIERATSVSTPLSLDIWADDDAKYTSGTNEPMRRSLPPVAIHWSMYRGPGEVTFDHAEPALDVLRGGKVGEPYSGRGVTTATFSEPGEYILHAIVSDYSGLGGGGEVCCWTNAMVKVTVTP
jgi:hypothetical protein